MEILYEKYELKVKDSFIDGIKNIENIQVTKDKEKGTRKILIKTSDQEEPIIIEIDKDNLIIGYENKELKEVGDNFLGYNKNLKTLNLPELEQTGNYFLYRNENLTTSNLSKLEQITAKLFGMRRKMIRGIMPNVDWERFGLSGTERAENLSPEMFATLAENLL